MINVSPQCNAEFIIENYTDEAGVHAGVERMSIIVRMKHGSGCCLASILDVEFDSNHRASLRHGSSGLSAQTVPSMIFMYHLSVVESLWH